jgi:hypothetical protein
MMFSQHLDGDSYRFSCSELESVEIFGKNPRRRRYLGKLWKLVFVSNFQKLRFFKKNLQRFVQPSNTNKSWKNFFWNNPKWQRKPRWRISVDLFWKIAVNQRYKIFETSNDFIFKKGPNFNKKIRYGKKNSKWQPKIKMASNVYFLQKKSIGTLPIM